MENSDAGFLCQVPATFLLVSSQTSTASRGRDVKGVTLAPILKKEKQRGQDACPRSHSRKATVVKCFKKVRGSEATPPG